MLVSEVLAEEGKDGFALISREEAARKCGPHGDQEGRYHDEK